METGGAGCNVQGNLVRDITGGADKADQELLPIGRGGGRVWSRRADILRYGDRDGQNQGGKRTT